MSFVKIDQIKVATLLRFKDENNDVIFVGKNKHPLLKKRNTGPTLFACEEAFMLNFPAGVAEVNSIVFEDDFVAKISYEAARELYEETGGLFLPEFAPEMTGELSDLQLHFDSSSLVPLNKTPILVEMYNSWKQQDISVAYFFFQLDVKIFTNQLVELEAEGDAFFVEILQRRLNLFCSKATQKFVNQDSFGEVLEYFPLDWEDFLVRLKILSKKTIGKDWFFKESNEEEIFFTTKAGKIAFNKAYFYAAMLLEG